jgi:DNA-binding IclR family transcriptional regulator
MVLRDLARNAGMPAAKARRYLVSFMRMGLVEQDANTGRYDLGEFALELGLASLARLDPVRLAGPVLDDLCEHIGETVALAMWGNHGATCVRWVEAGGPVTVTLRTGVVLPLTASATGLAFAAFYRSPYLRKMLDAEVQATAAAEYDAAAVLTALAVQLDEIRRHGIARASGSVTTGDQRRQCPGLRSHRSDGRGDHLAGHHRQLRPGLGQPDGTGHAGKPRRRFPGDWVMAASRPLPAMSHLPPRLRVPKPLSMLPPPDCRPAAAPAASRLRSPRRCPATPRASWPASAAPI